MLDDKTRCFEVNLGKEGYECADACRLVKFYYVLFNTLSALL